MSMKQRGPNGVRLGQSVMIVAMALGGCASLPAPDQLVAPTPIDANTGAYMCPYTKDGQLTKWVHRAIAAKVGAEAGKKTGKAAGETAGSGAPLLGGILGRQAGEKIGRSLAVGLIGGDAFIRRTSDQSFDRLDDLAVYLHVHHSTVSTYRKAVNATGEIYPEFAKRQRQALMNAPRKGE